MQVGLAERDDIASVLDGGEAVACQAVARQQTTNPDGYHGREHQREQQIDSQAHAHGQQRQPESDSNSNWRRAARAPSTRPAQCRLPRRPKVSKIPAGCRVLRDRRDRTMQTASNGASMASQAVPIMPPISPTNNSLRFAPSIAPSRSSKAPSDICQIAATMRGPTTGGARCVILSPGSATDWRGRIPKCR